MTRILITVIFLLCSLSSHAEFFIWHDEDGIKHVSTHPPECQQGGTFNYYQCSSLTVSPARARELAIMIEQRKVIKQADAFEKECASLKKRRDKLANEIKKYVSSYTSGGMTFGEMATVPLVGSTMRAKMFAIEMEYDKCFQEEERKRRKQKRNIIREQIAENAKQRAQDSMKDDIGKIKSRLGILF